MPVWQRRQLDELLENLPLELVVCTCDYSKNYLCRGQNEIQSQYFDVNKASLYKLLFCHASMACDRRESKLTEAVIIKEHMFVISDKPVQD